MSQVVPKEFRNPFSLELSAKENGWELRLSGFQLTALDNGDVVGRAQVNSTLHGRFAPYSNNSPRRMA